jgi:hypothetical protein
VKYCGEPDMTAINSRNDENLKNFLPELTKLYFNAPAANAPPQVVPKTIREYKNWLDKFDIQIG